MWRNLEKDWTKPFGEVSRYKEHASTPVEAGVQQ